jgi:hypothetical protein
MFSYFGVKKYADFMPPKVLKRLKFEKIKHFIVFTTNKQK